MTKSEQIAARKERLAAKLRENLRRRKSQIKARAEAGEGKPDWTGGPARTPGKI